MRRRLLVVTLAVTSLLVAAFAIPLGLLVRDVARDRALTDAERDLAALGPVLAVTTTDRDVLDAAVARTEVGRDGRLTVILPDGSTVGGDEPIDEDAVALASERRTAFSRQTDDGTDIYSPVIVGNGDEVVVLRAHVPSADLRRGVNKAWAILALVGAVLLAVAVAATDRLARSVTRPAADLAATSHALATGDPTARAEVAGPPEIAGVAEAINLLADRIDELRAVERERVADLSHRLRTPLTALRLDAEATGSDALIADVERLELAVSELIRTARRPLHDTVAIRCDLAVVVAERAAFWGALADDDGRHWTLHVDPAGPHWVRLSATDAAAALDVLLGNVFAHTPEGSAYSVTVAGGPTEVSLVVEDSGPGIPEHALARGTSGAGSTGLGIDIAASTAEVAGGRLDVGRSELGGARVALLLPTAKHPA